MAANKGNNSKLPKYLMLGPVIVFAISIVLYLFINFVVATSELDSLSTNSSTAEKGSSLADGAAVAQGEGQQLDTAPDSMELHEAMNIVLRGVGGIASYAFLPCLIVGIILAYRQKPSFRA